MSKINYSVNLFSESSKDLENFLNFFYKNNIKLNQKLSYEEFFENPIDMIELISTIIDNNDKFNIGIWISIDKDIFINITENNLDKIIRYLFERYPE